MNFIPIIIFVFFSIFIVLSIKPDSETEENFSATVPPPKRDKSKEELTKEVTGLFEKLKAENARHQLETQKIYDSLNKILSLSLDPAKQLQAKAPKPTKPFCTFEIKGRSLKRIVDLYNKKKSNPYYQLIQVYEKPVYRASRLDQKNKLKTYSIIYIDKSPKADLPYYLQARDDEKYGNIKVLFNDRCEIVDLVEIIDNVSF